MEFMDITLDDHKLIEVATTTIKNNFILGKHHVGAAVRMKSGKVYAGVHLESQNVDVCAEHVAMGMAVVDGEREFETIVAVTMRDVSQPTVISPCKICQELINFYGPDTWVIITGERGLKKQRVKELMVSV